MPKYLARENGNMVARERDSMPRIPIMSAEGLTPSLAAPTQDVRWESPDFPLGESLAEEAKEAAIFRNRLFQVERLIAQQHRTIVSLNSEVNTLRQDLANGENGDS